MVRLKALLCVLIDLDSLLSMTREGLSHRSDSVVLYIPRNNDTSRNSPCPDSLHGYKANFDIHLHLKNEQFNEKILQKKRERGRNRKMSRFMLINAYQCDKIILFLKMKRNISWEWNCWHLPISHRTPVYPGMQLHRYPLMSSVQVPWTQGELLHSSISYSKIFDS